MLYYRFLCLLNDSSVLNLSLFSRAAHTSSVSTDEDSESVPSPLPADLDLEAQTPTSPLFLGDPLLSVPVIPSFTFHMCSLFFTCSSDLTFCHYSGGSGQPGPNEQRARLLPFSPASDGDTAAGRPGDDAPCPCRAFCPEYLL